MPILRQGYPRFGHFGGPRRDLQNQVLGIAVHTFVKTVSLFFKKFKKFKKYFLNFWKKWIFWKIARGRNSTGYPEFDHFLTISCYRLVPDSWCFVTFFRKFMNFHEILSIFSDFHENHVFDDFVNFGHFWSFCYRIPLQTTFLRPPFWRGGRPPTRQLAFLEGSKMGSIFGPTFWIDFDHFLDRSLTPVLQAHCVFNEIGGPNPDPCKWSNFGSIFGPPGKSPKKWLFRFLLADLPKSHFFSTFFWILEKIGVFWKLAVRVPCRGHKSGQKPVKKGSKRGSKNTLFSGPNKVISYPVSDKKVVNFWISFFQKPWFFMKLSLFFTFFHFFPKRVQFIWVSIGDTSVKSGSKRGHFRGSPKRGHFDPFYRIS